MLSLRQGEAQSPRPELLWREGPSSLERPRAAESPGQPVPGKPSQGRRLPAGPQELIGWEMSRLFIISLLSCYSIKSLRKSYKIPPAEGVFQPVSYALSLTFVKSYAILALLSSFFFESASL